MSDEWAAFGPKFLDRLADALSVCADVGGVPSEASAERPVLNREESTAFRHLAVELRRAAADEDFGIFQLGEIFADLAEVVRTLSSQPLVGDLLIRAIELAFAREVYKISPVLHRTLAVIGVLREYQDLSSSIISLSAITSLFRGVDVWLRDVYGWGTPSSNLRSLVERVVLLIQATGFPAWSKPVDGSGTQGFLCVSHSGGWYPSSVGITLEGNDGGPNDQVLSIQPFATARFTLTEALGNGLVLALSAEGSLVAPGCVVIRPESAVQWVLGDIDGEARIQCVVRTETRGVSLRLIDGESLSLSLGEVSLGVTVSIDRESEFNFEAVVGELLLRVRFGDERSFWAQLVGRDGLSARARMAVTFSTRTGLHVDFALADGISFGGVIEFGGVKIGPIKVSAANETDGFALRLGSAFQATLGPVSASVGQIGVRLQTSSGSLGAMQLSAEFDPPSEFGLSIAAGPLHGAGLISFNRANGRYVGAIALTIDEIALRAVGILDTRASGVSGYSFLIIISAEFTPIQLGFGFTLNGVGGICGIQRSISVPALQSGVRDGSLAPLLFSRDPIAQAAQLVTGLQRIFPPTSDRYVFGPMFKLGWGTPTLLTVDIGIVLQLPAPIIIALIGTLSATFPRPEAAVVVLNIDIVGVLDTGEKRLSIDASLRDSRVGPFTLTGDMALRLHWGNEPDFALSLGGFNPSFTPPPSFPQLRRLALSLGTGSNPRISLSAYLALTSNTLQVGARAELYAEAAGFNILGYVEFHALFIFSPFSFRFNFAAGVALRRGSTVLAGVSVTGQIDGPRPWHVKGSASITILFFDVSVDFDTTFGDRPTPEQIETVDVWARLQPALEDVRNWSATLPAGRSRGVSVASDQEVPARVRLDPMSELAVRQKVLPLDRRLTKLGEGRIEGPVRYRVSAVRIGAGTDGRGGDTVSSLPVEEPFAPGQYETLTDAQRLSRPSFEPMPAGVKVQGAAATTAGAAGLTARTIRCRSFRASIAGDDPGASRSVAARLQAQMQSASAAQLTAMRSTGMERYALAPGASPLVTLAPQTWTLASTDTLSGAAGSTGTWGQTADALRSQRASDPSQQGALQIVPTFERRP